MVSLISIKLFKKVRESLKEENLTHKAFSLLSYNQSVNKFVNHSYQIPLIFYHFMYFKCIIHSSKYNMYKIEHNEKLLFHYFPSHQIPLLGSNHCYQFLVCLSRNILCISRNTYVCVFYPQHTHTHTPFFPTTCSILYIVFTHFFFFLNNQ